MNRTEFSLCTTGGTLLSTLAISAGDLLRTVILAATGAVVSFLITLLLKQFSGRRKDSS